LKKKGGKIMAKNATTDCRVAIIGAGPYGLAAAAHLRAAAVETCLFGEAMEFWATQMPRGMRLRSSWAASHISDPRGELTLDRYQADRRTPVPRPIPPETFIGYGRWFQQRAAPDLDRRRVVTVEAAPGRCRFRLRLDDGAEIHARRVVVAAGIAPFARRLHRLRSLPRELVSHACEHCDLSPFAGRRVVVVGGGQSALESAALLHEAGAEVEVIARAPAVHWLDQKAAWLKSAKNPLRPLLYPPTDVGPPGLNWIVAIPALFRSLPRRLQTRVAHRSIRPAGSGWLIPRLAEARITTGREVQSARPCGDGLLLKLDDGSERHADHLLEATGYQVDIFRHPFLPPELLSAVRTVDGYPRLGPGFESSLPGLHFIGAPAAYDFGPVCRFVAGSSFTGRLLARKIARAGQDE